VGHIWGGAVRGGGLSGRLFTVRKSAVRNQQLAPCSLKAEDETVAISAAVDTGASFCLSRIDVELTSFQCRRLGPIESCRGPRAVAKSPIRFADVVPLRRCSRLLFYSRGSQRFGEFFNPKVRVPNDSSEKWSIEGPARYGHISKHRLLGRAALQNISSREHCRKGVRVCLIAQ
jgi:hypothetical protein